MRADAVLSTVYDVVKSCEWDTYIVVSQPSVSAHDFANPNTSPHLRRWATGSSREVKSFVTIPEVLGDLDEDRLVRALQLECEAPLEEIDASPGYVPIDNGSKRTIKVSFSPAPNQSKERTEKLREHDEFLGALLTGFADQKYVVIYTTTPSTVAVHHDAPHHEMHLYDNDDPFQQALHMDLKRDFVSEQKGKNASLPLFEKYEYFNPAIFMGILVSIVLFLILYVGITGVAGLEVSYYSFSKEMGPAAQKKQQ